MSGVNFRRVGTAAVIELDDASTRNALNDEIVAEIRKQLRVWVAEGDIKGLILTGANDSFSSGGSLDMIERRKQEAKSETGRAAIAATMRENAKLISELRAFPAPTVAAIDGACVGAAIGWACACDMRIATDRVKFITGYIKVGLGSDFGAARLLAEVVGRGRAAEWLLTSTPVAADQAARFGLVSSLHSADQLLNEAIKIATGADPRAAVIMRANLDDARLELDEALNREADRFTQLL